MDAIDAIDAMDPDTITLRAGALRAALRPDLGASLSGLWMGDEPVMRSTEARDLAGPRRSACFPLVPYSNRLGHCSFAWQGRRYTTLPNFDDSPHSLHGVGWLRAWQTLSVDERSARLRYRHEADAHWPFTFEVTQTVALEPNLLQLEMQIVNTDAREQPVGLGWHPYFPRRPRSHLRIDVAARWEPDETKLPTRCEAVEPIDADVASLSLDHCHSGWRAPAIITDERFVLRLDAAADLAHLVVFTPAGQPHYCVEPVSHVTDAIHAADPASRGLVTLAPGASFDTWMTLTVENA